MDKTADPLDGFRQGVVCVREPSCICLGQRAPSFQDGDEVYVYILQSAGLLQVIGDVVRASGTLVFEQAMVDRPPER